MTTLKDLLRDVTAQLQAFEDPAREAKRLICVALDLPAYILITDGNRPVSIEDISKVESYLERRLCNEPLSRIQGVREFWSLPFHLNEHTLDPRPDSECLVEGVLKYMPADKPQTLLDLGTGTGCLLISLLHERPLCEGIGVDLEPLAADQAFRNAQKNGTQKRSLFISGFWAEALKSESFDVVISNPPYIATAENLMPEVSLYDPSLALYGGDDGLECYRTLAPQIKRMLKKGGVVALEIGHTQATAVRAIFEDCGFQFLELLQDLGGRDRCLIFNHV